MNPVLFYIDRGSMLLMMHSRKKQGRKEEEAKSTCPGGQAETRCFRRKSGCGPESNLGPSAGLAVALATAPTVRRMGLNLILYLWIASGLRSLEILVYLSHVLKRRTRFDLADVSSYMTTLSPVEDRQASGVRVLNGGSSKMGEMILHAGNITR